MQKIFKDLTEKAYTSIDNFLLRLEIKLDIFIWN